MFARSHIVRIILSVLALAVVVTAFLGVARWRQQSRQADLVDLRASAPQAWLDEMRWREGFPHYLEAVRDLKHFEAWHEDAPLFLIGRWAEEPADAPDLRASLEDHCRTGYVFEDARLRRFGEGAFTRPARYRIDDQGRILIDTGAHQWRLRPDPNGPALRHLRLTAPDGGEVDLLRCG